jgi:hypothetical protein
MPAKRTAPKARKASSSSGRAGAAKGKAKTPPRSAPSPPRQGKKDQIGSVMAKGLDLAEAGLTFGLNLVQKLGTTVQDQVIGKIAEAGRAFVQPAPDHSRSQEGESTTVGAGDETARYAQASASAGGFGGISNRLPLFPGSTVHVSFSINNESAQAAKKVSVRLEGLVGELSGAPLQASRFSIKPAAIAIKPLDFEKFVITGVIPATARSDAYNGWIVVTGDDTLRIPVKLVITGPA